MLLRVLCAVVSAVALAPAIAAAQSPSSPSPALVSPLARPGSLISPVSADDMPQQVISVNAPNFLYSVVDAEYERRVSPSVTAGAATRFGPGDHSTPCCVGDLFIRVYPSGEPFNGLSVGARAGFAAQSGAALANVGIDLTHSVMVNRHLYIGTGLGLKRMLRNPDGVLAIRYIPTLRFNVGVGF